MNVKEFIYNVNKFRSSLRKFDVTLEEFLFILRERCDDLENISNPTPQESIIQLDSTSKTISQRFLYMESLPLELKILILQFSGPKTFFCLVGANKAWNNMLKRN